MPIRIGSTPKEQSNGSKFWGLKAGETKDVVILHDVNQIVSAEQVALWDFNPAVIWTCADLNDPSRDMGIKPAYRAYIPILVDVDGKREVKVWSCTRTVHTQLCDIAEALGESLVGLVVKAKRTGEGLSTKYSVVATGKRAKNMPDDIPTSENIIEMLDVKDRDGIIAHIEEISGMDYDSFVTKVRAEAKPAQSGTGASRKPGPVSVDDF